MMEDSNENNETVDVEMAGDDDTPESKPTQQTNSIPTSTTGEDDVTSGSMGDATEGTDGGSGGRSGGRGGRYNRRGGRGRGGGRGFRGRNFRRHSPYNHPSNNQNEDDEENENEEDRGRRVYVGNLSWDVGWTDLKDHMKTTGCEVTRADVMLGYDGRSKGCGIVEFATTEGARRAVLTLNDTELMGRPIFVREDRESKGDGGGGGGGGGESTLSGNTNSHESSSGGDAQSRRCYVGNLAWDVAWQDLKDHMRQEGGDVVFAEVMTEPDGRSKGCGIVEYATPEEAQNAIANLTDTELKGRMIFVREDREIGGGGGNAGGSGGGGGGGHRGSASVFVGNLAFETSWQDLKDHMRGAGNVDQANILTGDDGRSKGCGIVLYQRAQDAQRAIRELHNSQLHGRPILVREDREQGGGGKRRGGNYGGGGGSAGTQLFIGNLSFDTTWRELKDHFRQCGDVERAEVMEGPDGRKKGFGTVKFYRQKDASNAIRRLNGTELQGRRLEVRLDLKA